ncbi:nitroreductase family protein [Herminiimonas sp. CN]|uniref:nitroreductase family protein n=1 Tax=Herminiimonas sp. CN TaxID=1349818 RepID=UPI0005519AB8|nr:nitroreductase family protein [Herminiimonas sp. CN]
MSQSIDTMTIRDAIYGRCSVRSYTSERIDQPTLHTLLAAAVRAPTAMHGEPWQFAIVQDAELLKRLSDRAKELFSAEAAHLHPDQHSLAVFTQPSFNVFYDAGTLVVICAKNTGHFALADCWLAAQNLMLAAHGMGLGTCVIGSAASALNLPDVKLELGIPPATTAVAPIIVGKPRGEALASARNEPQVLAWR